MTQRQCMHDADLVLAADDYEVSAVPNRLQQALENLFRNAIEHGLDGGDGAPGDGGPGDGGDVATPVGPGDASTPGPTDAAVADGAEDGEVVASVDAGTTAVGSGFTVTVGRIADAGGFFVADNGPGIPADLRDRIFERGVSGRNGTGLGLAIVESVANEHDLAVGVTESEAGVARFDFRV